ncbi:MAG TPA: alpha/beta hydrolase [Streptosporangiaceae bacterium]|nr:alpha/beta hydrolase [Streptosporangiaceae bacterium]
MRPELRLLELFPQNEDWSLQTFRLLAEVAVGGADLFECARTAARIGDSDDVEVWHREWSRTAREVAGHGRAEAAKGHTYTASRALFRSLSYWRHSEFFFDSSDPRRAQAYTEGVRAFREAAELQGGYIEQIGVPFEGEILDGYLVKPDLTGARRPTVLFLGGADSWAEELVFLGGNQFPARGLNLVVVDTPGRGGTLRFKKIYSRPDYEVPVRAILDHLESRQDVDAGRIGLAGVSLGGYYAPRAAAMEPRVKAVAAWCGTWQVLTDFYDFYPPLQKQLQWLLGAADDADARQKLTAFSLDGYAQRISVPVYVLHGTDDVIMDLAGARTFVANLTTEDVTFQVYDGPGALHCSYDYAATAVAALTDWFADRLGVSHESHPAI